MIYDKYIKRNGNVFRKIRKIQKNGGTK